MCVRGVIATWLVSNQQTTGQNRSARSFLLFLQFNQHYIERAIAAAQRATGIENRADLLAHIAQTFIDQADKEVKQ